MLRFFLFYVLFVVLVVFFISLQGCRGVGQLKRFYWRAIVWRVEG